MRVCDITKREPVTTRIVMVELPLDAKPEDTFDSSVRVIHDLEIGASAAGAIEAKNWHELNQLTPYDERPKSAARQAGAQKAAETRRERRAAKERAATAEPTA